MVREISKSDYSDEELENLKLGKCWCGKPKSEFDKNMRVYCSKKHQKDWYSRTITWSVFKDEVLFERGKKCVQCGVVPDDKDNRFKKAMDEWKQKFLQIPSLQEKLESIRIQKLNELEEKYQKIMDDDYLIEHELYYELRDTIGDKPFEHRFEIHYEVDHIQAVALDGNMWDKENLQILCSDCHKVKTNQDMKKIKAKRRGLKPFEVSQ